MTAASATKPDDHSCRVCGAFGAFGTRINRQDWRKGYVWHCADHRPVASDIHPDPAPVLPVKDRGQRQGRLL